MTLFVGVALISRHGYHSWRDLMRLDAWLTAAHEWPSVALMAFLRGAVGGRLVFVLSCVCITG